MEFIYRKCTESDLTAILKLQEEAFQYLDDQSMLRRNTSETLQSCLREPHYTLGAYDHDKLAAFSILYDGKDTAENLGRELYLQSDELRTCVNLKLVIVSVKYRGRGLQKKLMDQLLQTAEERGYNIVCATVSPQNIYSIENFKACGFQYVKIVEKYGGLKRNIYSYYSPTKE